MKRAHITLITLILITLFAPPTHAQIRSDIDNRLQQGPIIVDHDDVQLYHQIPETYLQAAENIRVFFANRSVGGNINDGLSCLQSTSENAANHCVRYQHVDPSYASPQEIVTWTQTADRSNWTFLYWNELNCPNTDASGWSGRGACTDEHIRLNHSSYDVVTFEHSYLAVNENSGIDNLSNGYNVDGSNYDVYDMVDLQTYLRSQSQGTNKLVIYMSSSLARGIGSQTAVNFNNQLKTFAENNNKILLDVADIISTDPNDNPCYDNRDGVEYCNNPPDNTNCENEPDDGLNLQAICQHYTTELHGGHLYSPGKIQVAQGFWVLMAQIAGWEPGTDPPPPPQPGDYHPYPDGDNDVDIDDFWEVVRNFVNRTYSIFNFNQVITHFGT